MPRLRPPPGSLPPAEPIERYDAKKIEALGLEIDAAVRAVAVRHGLGYRRKGAACYKHGVAVDLFLAFPNPTPLEED